MVKLVLDDSPQGLLEKCQILMLRFQVYKLILCRYVDLISTEQFDNNVLELHAGFNTGGKILTRTFANSITAWWFGREEESGLVRSSSAQLLIDRSNWQFITEKWGQMHSLFVSSRLHIFLYTNARTRNLLHCSPR
jgi:hypothetical protein